MFGSHIASLKRYPLRALSDMLAPHRGKKSRTSLEATPSSVEESSGGPAIVLPSSTELFYFYAQILEQCSKLFNGKPLFDLCNLQKKWLKIYAGPYLTVTIYDDTDQSNRRCPVTKLEKVNC